MFIPHLKELTLLKSVKINPFILAEHKPQDYTGGWSCAIAFWGPTMSKAGVNAIIGKWDSNSL